MTLQGTQTDRRLFSEVSALVSVSPHAFEAEIDPGWTIAGKPNGGYLLALLGRAAIEVTKAPNVLAASAHYLEAPVPGPATIEVEPLRAGRSASQARARLEQAGRACVEALVTTGGLASNSRPFWHEGLPARSRRGFEDCEPLTPRLLDGSPVALLEQVHDRIDPETAGFVRGAPAGRGELRGWLELPGDEAFDAVSLLFALDAFPPATFDIEARGWVPTLELTAYVRALPTDGPVEILQRAQLVSDHKVDETCCVWDQSGRLVAQGTQLAAIRLG